MRLDDNASSRVDIAPFAIDEDRGEPFREKRRVKAVGVELRVNDDLASSVNKPPLGVLSAGLEVNRAQAIRKSAVEALLRI